VERKVQNLADLLNEVELAKRYVILMPPEGEEKVKSLVRRLVGTSA